MIINWDIKKAASNLKKHGVSFPNAATVFYDPLAVTASDPDHSIGENRYLTFGIAITGNLLTISHTFESDVIRVISARAATKPERLIYEEG